VKRSEMSAAAPAITKHQLETNLIEKCWKDPGFREKVLKDPKGMLEGFFGKSLPSDYKVVIHEEDANTLHLAIPPAPSKVTELSDEELERVAGGTELAVLVTALTVAAATGIGVSIGKSAGW
jgi:hypothetical protein